MRATLVAHRALAFRGVTVVDVARGRLLPDQTVVVVDRWIRAVGPTRSTRVPAGAQVVNAHSKYLIPGLWDMEYSTENLDKSGRSSFQELQLKLLIANGVTGYRQMDMQRDGLTIDSMLEWQRKITAGTWIGPRIPVGTPRLEGVDSTQRDQSHNIIHLATPAQARAVVDSLQAAGPDHIFVYTIYRMKREIVFALLAETRRLGILVGGHLPDAVTLTEASDSGMRSVDHLMGLENICINFTMAQAHPPVRIDSTASLVKCTPLATRLRQNHTWIGVGPLGFVAPKRITDQALRRRWQSLPKRLRPEVPDSGSFLATWRSQSQHFPIPKDAFAIADRAGVPLLMTTDGPFVGGPGGAGGQLHYNLASVVEHGLRPLTALQAATLNAAEYLGATDTLGTVQAGKLADLVLLDANPLEDIYNAQRIQAVVANGRYFSRAGLDSLLQQTASAP